MTTRDTPQTTNNRKKLNTETKLQALTVHGRPLPCCCSQLVELMLQKQGFIPSLTSEGVTVLVLFEHHEKHKTKQKDHNIDDAPG